MKKTIGLVLGLSVVVQAVEFRCLESADVIYSGYYCGANMPQGLYTFTDLFRPVETAVRVSGGSLSSSGLRGIGFNGKTFIAVGQDGKMMHRCEKMADAFSRIGTYDYSDWNGIEFGSQIYYGIYRGTSAAMEGNGLYVFSDPSDPENTCVKIYSLPDGFSEVWTDFAFDGQRYLFVRTGAGDGRAGIYQYNPEDGQFTLVSGSETYSDWKGLAAFNPAITPLPGKKVFLLLFAGQSNALGWGYHQYLADNKDPLQFPQDDVELFYKSNRSTVGILPENTLVPLQSGSSNFNVKQPGEYPALTTEPISRFGPELSFAGTVRGQIKIPGSKVVVVKYAFGGSSVGNAEQWWPDGTACRSADGKFYRTFQETVWRCIAAIRHKYPYHELEIPGMGWVQGESDAIDGYQTEYEENLTRFIADVRATFGKDITFVLSKLSPNQLQGAPDPVPERWPVIIAAQEAVAAVDPNVAATDTIGPKYAVSAGLSEGHYHFKTEGLLQIGTDLAHAMMEIQNSKFSSGRQ